MTLARRTWNSGSKPYTGRYINRCRRTIDLVDEAAGVHNLVIAPCDSQSSFDVFTINDLVVTVFACPQDMNEANGFNSTDLERVVNPQ